MPAIRDLIVLFKPHLNTSKLCSACCCDRCVVGVQFIRCFALVCVVHNVAILAHNKRTLYNRVVDNAVMRTANGIIVRSVDTVAGMRVHLHAGLSIRRK